MIKERIKKVFPEEWDDEDIANYNSMISNARNILGKELSYDDEFLLDMSARLTIMKKKHYISSYNDEELKLIKERNNNAFNSGTTFETPLSEWSVSDENPINWSEDKLNERYINKENV